jgi:hypothetical protein
LGSNIAQIVRQTKDTQIMTILQLKGILWTKNWLQEAERNYNAGRKGNHFCGSEFQPQL